MNMQCMNDRAACPARTMSDEQRALLCKIRAYDFTLIETALYLDGYHSGEALSYFCENREKLRELKKQYEEQYGPLTQDAVNVENGWTWVQSPWPWELEAN